MRLVISFTIFTDQQITICKPLQNGCCDKYPQKVDLIIIVILIMIVRVIFFIIIIIILIRHPYK